MPHDVAPLLEVNDLRVRFPTSRGVVHAVNGVSFSIRPGERVAVVGESGSGKSVTALSLLGLTPNPGVVSGSVRYKEQEIIGASERDLARVRGGEIGLVLQDAKSALNPLRSIGSQIEEPLRMHTTLGRKARRSTALELVRNVRIEQPELRVRQRSHELSGGMAQRAVTASVIGPEPELLIADEPTSALDATTAEGIIELLGDLGQERGLAVLMITHDLGVVASFAQRVIVMYAGRIVESASVDEIFSHPRHPYTRGLLQSIPGQRGRRPVQAIPGTVPDLIAPPSGCAFHPRCRHANGRARCQEELPLLAQTSGASIDHLSACHFQAELVPLPPPAAINASDEGVQSTGEDLLVVDDLSKRFVLGEGTMRKGRTIKAVQGVSFAVRRGEVLALVGESGSGKTTTGRLILGLETPTSGRISFDGMDITGAARRGVPELNRRMQVVFQTPDSSLDPRMRVQDIIAEPLEVHQIGTASEREARVHELIEHVGLRTDHLARYSFELSGGQRQRIAIARALAPRPDIIICDEPLTALDVSVQAQILNLLTDIQRRERLAYLFVAHDLAVVRQIADRVAVMFQGKIVELADADRFFAQPQHPYSEQLLAAMSHPDPAAARRRRERVRGESHLESVNDASERVA